MNPPKNFDRYLGIAQRLLIRGRLPALLLGVARKTRKRGLKLGEARDTLGLFHQLLLAWWRGQYQGVSRKTLLTVAGGLVYFLLPIDLIPDWVPMFGLFDDLAVLAWIGKACSDEIETFRTWRDNRSATQQASLAALPDQHERPAPGVALDQLRDQMLLGVRISRQHWRALLDELESARRSRRLLTYSSVIERLCLPQPAMVTLTTTALEYLAALDHRQGRPLRSALVISQGGTRIPREGFFECVRQLGALQDSLQATDTVSWHAAEVTRLFEHSYPDRHQH